MVAGVWRAAISAELRAAFAKVAFTPPASIPLWWVVGQRTSTGTHSPLQARIALLDDGHRRAAVVALDLTLVTSATVAVLREAVSEGAELAAADVLVCCTHTHSTPNLDYGDLHPDFAGPLVARLTEVAASARGDLEPVRFDYCSILTEGLTFSRRPVYAGNEVAAGGPSGVEHFLRFEGAVDPQLQLAVARRPDGSAAGGFAGFACHPHVMAPEPVWSADFPGALAERLGDRHGGTFLYLQGASGDLHWVDRAVDGWWSNWWVDPPVLAEGPRRRAVACCERHADGLFAAAERALPARRSLDAGRIGVSARVLQIEQRVPTAEQVELCRWYLAQEPGSVDPDDFSRRVSGHAYAFYENSPLIQGLFARLVTEIAAEQSAAADSPPREDVEVQVVAAGELAFVGYPAEMFTEFGLRTKAGSPFAATFVCTLANGGLAYVPTEAAYEHGGYETRLGPNRLVPEAGNAMVSCALELLQALSLAG
jgi:neutral ceramidase